MEELLEHVASLKEELNNTSEVKKIKELNKKLKSNPELKSKIERYQITKSQELLTEIYNNELYKEYKQAETDLNILILYINNELKRLNSKGKCGL